MTNIDIIKIIIGLCGTLVGATLSTFLKNYLDTRNYFTISKSRKTALKGVWKGIVNQNITETTYQTYKVELSLNAKWKTIVGDGKIYSEKGIVKVILNGYFRNDRYLKMNYQNKDTNIIQFGAFIFELSSDNKTLKGKLVGYGHINEKVIYGNAIFEKE